MFGMEQQLHKLNNLIAPKDKHDKGTSALQKK